MSCWKHALRRPLHTKHTDSETECTFRYPPRNPASAPSPRLPSRDQQHHVAPGLMLRFVRLMGLARWSRRLGRRASGGAPLLSLVANQDRGFVDVLIPGEHFEPGSVVDRDFVILERQ